MPSKFYEEVKHWSLSKYCCISTKHLNITPNNYEQNRTEQTKKQKRAEQIKNNEEEQNRTKQNRIERNQTEEPKRKNREPLRDGCNG
jgi:hypothetical protein